MEGVTLRERKLFGGHCVHQVSMKVTLAKLVARRLREGEYKGRFGLNLDGMELVREGGLEKEVVYQVADW